MKKYDNDFLEIINEIDTHEFIASQQEIEDTTECVIEQLNLKPKNKRVNKVWIYGMAAVAACTLIIAFATLFLGAPQGIPDNKIAEISPTPTVSSVQTTPLELPDAYSQKLCSVAYQVDDWIYFAHRGYYNQDEDGIYKLKKNSTTPIKLCDVYTTDIIVDGDYIYFTETLSNSPDKLPEISVMRIKTDGSGKTEIFKSPESGYVSDLQLSDGYLFFTDISAIYKITIDGSKYEKYIDHSSDQINFLTVQDGWMYYNHRGEDWQRQLVKKRIDGTGETVLRQGPTYSAAIYGDWIYFIGFGNEKEFSYTYLAKIKTDGTGFKELKRHINSSFHNDGFGLHNNLSADDNWVYFSFHKKSEWLEWPTAEICRIRADGTDDQVLASECTMTSVTDDYIYYNNYWDNNSASFVSKLMQMKKDGSEKQRIEFFAKGTTGEETYEVQENSLSVIVKDAYEKDGKKYVVLDQVTEYEADGTYGFNNENKNVREFEISDDAKFVMLKDGKDKVSLTEVDWKFFKENSNKQLMNKSKKVPGYYKIAMGQNGVIMKIQFFYWYGGSVKLPYEILETEVNPISDKLVPDPNINYQ